MENPAFRTALRLAILFALIAGLWTLFSDIFLRGHITDPRLLGWLDTLKDEAFVVVTALLLYFLLRRELQRLARRDAQILEIEQRLHLHSTALESAANAILIADREGRIIWVNPAFSRLTGYTATEAIGRNPRLLKSERHDQAFYKDLWETILSGRVWRGEIVNRRKDGSLYFEEQTIAPVQDGQGTISHFIGIKQDITERKLVEGALRESEGKYRNLVEKTSDWVWEIDEKNRYTYVSPRIREILGYAPEEVLGKTPFDLMPANEAKRAAEVFAPISGQMKPFVLFDNVNLDRQGHRIVLETSGTPIFDSQGVFRGYRGIDRDVTERKRAEEALRDSEQRYRLLFESNPHPMWVYDLETLAFLAVNDAAVRHYGYTRDEFLAMTIRDIRPPEDVPSLIANLARATSGLDEAGIWRHRKKDGTVIQVEVISHTLTFAGCQAKLILAHDVTQRRQAEEALRTRTRQLEAIRVVTAEITRELDLTRLLELIAQRAGMLLAAGSATVFLWDEATQILTSAARHGAREWNDVVRLRPGEGVAGAVAQRREGMVVNDYRASPYAHPFYLERTSTTAVVGEPLLYRDRLVGVITTDNDSTGRPFTDQDWATLALFAAPAAIAIENARLFAAAQHELGERQRAEQGLARERALLQTLIDNVPDRIYIKDIQGRYLIDNVAHQHCLRAAGPEEVAGKTIFDFYPPEMAERSDADDRRVMATGQPLVNWEEVSPDRDTGTTRWDLTTKVPLRDGEGRVTGIVSIARDITDYKRAEAALRESEAGYRRIVETAQEGIAALDADGRFTFLNRKMAEMLGQAPEEVIGQPFLAFMDQTEHGSFAASMERRRRGVAEQFERRLRRKDGSELVALISASPIHDEQGRYTGSFGMLTDITERTRAERALSERTRQLESIRAISEEVTRELDLTILLDLVQRRAAELVGAKRGAILLWDEAIERLVTRAWHGYGSWVAEIPLQLGEGVVGIVAQRREGLIINNYPASPYAHPLFLERSLDAAVLCEPLLYRDRLLGAILLAGSPSDRQFTGEDQQLLRLFAAQAAIAIENARLHSAAVRRGEELEALLRATRSVMSGLDLQGILDRILAEAGRISGCSHVKVLLVEKETGVLRVGALQGTAMSGEDRLPLGKGHSGIVAATGQPLFSNDCPNDPRNAYAERDRELGIVTYLGLPIKSRGEVIGVLSFNTTGPRHYTPDEVAYLTSFADHAAIAIENARFHQTAVRQARQLGTLNELTAALTTALDPVAAAQEILSAVQILIPGAVGRLWEWEEQESVLRLVAGVGLRHPEGGRTPTLRSGEGLAGAAATARQPVISQDVRRDPRFLNHAWADAEGLVSCIILPLLYSDRVTGVLAIYTRDAHDFTAEEVRLLNSFSAQAAIALENARLHSAAVWRGQQLEALLRATRSVMSDPDLPSILDRIVMEAAQMAGTRHVTVMLVDKTAQVLRVAAFTGNPVPVDFSIHVGQDLSGIVAQTGQSVFSEDSPGDPRNLLAERDRELSFATYLGLPIKVGNEVLGVLSFDTVEPRQYTPAEIAYLESFAAQAAIAIEKARLYQESRQHAATLEQRVQDRTRELEEARTQAENASRHKSEFLANMSHELRTPLNSILGFSQLLQEQNAGPLNEKQLRYIGHIYQGGEHLLELVNDVLDLSKVEAGKLTLQCETLSVTAILEEVSTIVRTLANKKDQVFEAQVEPILSPLRADPIRFKQICLNLLSNAVKFTPPEGRISLTARGVTVENQESPSPLGAFASTQYLEIRVSDTGIGIKPDDLSRLFREFTQLEAAATKRYEGTGLGLALSKRLVELHGGRISVESEGEGQGTTFTVMLPFGGPRD